MSISTANKEFIDSLVDYYTSEAGSYRQIAERYEPEIRSVPDAAFGIIVGCIYSGFLEACKNQGIQPGLDEMTELNDMLKSRAASVKKAIMEASSDATKEAPKDDQNGNSVENQEVCKEHAVSETLQEHTTHMESNASDDTPQDAYNSQNANAAQDSHDAAAGVVDAPRKDAAQ